jgi:YD repeat-containing protein
MDPPMSQTKFRRHALVSLLLASLTVPLALVVHAQTTNPEQEYKKLVKVDQEITPLGENPFGESVNVFDGSLSFNIVDITIPGTGPTIQISRTFKADGDADVRMDNASLGDWDLDLPRLTTLTSNVGTGLGGPPSYGWVVATSTRTDRCANFRSPPDIQIGKAGPDNDPVKPTAWWNEGYTLRIPGVADQDILSNSLNLAPSPTMPGVTVKGVSKGNWRLACLPNTSNGQPGDAFLAIGPDGTKYSLDLLAYRAARSYKILRQYGYMFGTHVEDRFGNYVNYTYDATGHIQSINASDGRRVTFAPTADGKQIGSITVVAGDATRTWSYGYSPTPSGQTLTSVQLPDGSRWTYDLFQLTFSVYSSPKPGDCLDVAAPDGSLLKTGAITAPSGLQGTFEARPTQHARSGVYSACETAPAGTPRYNARPRYSNNLALQRKVISGAGLAAQQWTYAYPLASASWTSECNVSACNYTSYSDVVDPSGNATRYWFSNRADVSEGKPLRTEYYAGAVSASPIRIETYEYASSAQGPWPAQYGSTFNFNGNQDRAQSDTPMTAKHIYQDGDTYNWQALDFDVFARPNAVRRSSSAGYSVDERTTYQDDFVHWVVGLPLQTDNLTTGETASRNVYDPNSLTLSERYRFGRKVMGYTFNAQGQLASFTDGNNHATSLGNYKRGIPQSIGYPDGTSQSLAVDDFGQIASITNQAGATTSYGYTEIGRIGSITYPAADTTVWNTTVFGYALIGASERGITGAHWRRSTARGNKVEMTYFDAMLRPIIQDTYRYDGGLYTSSRTDYDWKGRKTFQSYPYDGAPDLNAMGYGVLNRYDALGRQTQLFQHAEIGDLLTTTDYLAGASKRVTDPRGIATTTAFQVFDQPSYDSAISVQAPEGVLQTIARDVYGNPLSITQAGGGLSLTKTMTYDNEHRLCRTWEPESGSEIMAYDGADNLAWSMAGASFNGAGCGQDQVAENSKTSRGYDAMNRVTSVIYPTGTQPSTFTYDALGNPATATAGMVSWTYGRNKLGLMTTETLGVDGWSWSLGYDYDGNGALSQVHYPDGEVVPYNPDALGRPTTVGGYVSGIAYFADNDVKSYAMGNGGLYAAEKNARNLIFNFTYGKNGAPSVSEDFVYDANGNVSQIIDQSGSQQRTKSMSYDGLNRLLSATASNLWGTETYTYDTLNNIRTMTGGGVTKTYNYDGANLLASITSGGAPLHTFAYDPRGNTIGKDGQTLKFDLANRLTSLPGKGDYTYDASGRRVKKVTPSATTYYAYNSAGQLMWEYDNATTNGKDYIYLGKKLVADSKGVTSTIVGAIDRVVPGTDATLIGWACSTGLDASINVHLYAGGPAGTGTIVGAYQANLASEPAVAAACHANGTAYRFSIPLTEANRIQFARQPLYVHGISPVGNANLTINGSGTVTMPPSTSVPPSPASVSASVTADLSTITVSWAASATATSYTLERSFNGQAWAQLWVGAATSVPLTQPGDGQYVFRITACNANGCSDPVASNGVTIAHVPAALPSISVPATSSGAVDISWPAIAYATRYELEHSTDGNWPQIYSGTATSATINEPVSGNWYYRVRACNANGCGGYATSTYVPVTLPPTGATTVNGAGTNNSGSYAIGWNGVAAATYYNVFENVNATTWGLIGQTSAGIWSLGGKADGTYYYAVQACNAGGCGPWSGTIVVSVAHIPDVPTAYIRLSNTGKRENYTMTWTALPYATSYQILRMPGNSIVYTANGSSFLLEGGFEPYERKFTYQIRSCNALGCSAWSRSM